MFASIGFVLVPTNLSHLDTPIAFLEGVAPRTSHAIIETGKQHLNYAALINSCSHCGSCALADNQRLETFNAFKLNVSATRTS